MDNISNHGTFFTIVFSNIDIQNSFLLRNKGLESSSFRLLEGISHVKNVTFSESVADSYALFLMTKSEMTIEDSEIYNITNKNCLGNM